MIEGSEWTVNCPLEGEPCSVIQRVKERGREEEESQREGK